jgi:beta-lactam-binding protein with PASTA domain
MLGSRPRSQPVRHEVETELYEAGPPPALPPEEPPPSRELWPWLVVLLLLVLAGAAAAYYATKQSDRRAAPATTVIQAALPTPPVKQAKKPKPLTAGQIRVPRLIGVKAPEALAALRRLELTGEVRGVFSKKPRGLVVAQAPSPGSKIAKDASVKLQVSKGNRAVPIPDVVGQDADQAVATLKAAGFETDVANVPSEEPESRVVAQHPRGGEKAPSGSAVRINVSSGTPIEEKAKADGKTKNNAERKTKNKADEKTKKEQAPTPPPAPSVSVPDLVGSTLGSARAQLRADGLVTEIRRVPSSEPKDAVTGQSPSAGTPAKRGDHVFLTVSLGPTNAQTPAKQTTLHPVPSVIGADQASAAADLRAAGFRVAVVDQPTDDLSQDGIVVDEDPAPGSRAAPGSTVTIFVGRSTG